MSKNDQFSFAVLEDFRSGSISREQASILLGCSERAITRRVAKLRTLGMEGIKHGNTRRPPVNKLHTDFKEKVLTLVRSRYYDFNLLHLKEILLEKESIDVSYTTLRRWCRGASLLKHKRKNRISKVRTYRERMSSEGLLLQMDGSHHAWNNRDKWCLIAMIDDATSEIPYCEFFDTEDTVNCMKVLESVIALKGIPQAVYVDKAGWFGGTKRVNFSQFERACNELGIRVIYANSPEAKGRIERAWKTFQDRLIPELRINGIKGKADANAYLRERFLPAYWNQRNRVEARNSRNCYRDIPTWTDLGQIFCIKDYRQVGKAMTFAYENKIYQITSRDVIGLSGTKIEIRSYRDGSWAVYRNRNPLAIKEVIRPKRQALRPAS